jgi:anionic cell wall polymer biosynthesis LytR-Cps2A-Psr (LCP) family protein
MGNLETTSRTLSFSRPAMANLGAKRIEVGNDFGRSLRQHSLIVAVKNQILKIGSIPKIIPLLNNIAKNVQTDSPIEYVL